jgi:hypothetical protein
VVDLPVRFFVLVDGAPDDHDGWWSTGSEFVVLIRADGAS